MLYDQAQLATSYIEAFQITKRPYFEEIARDILDVQTYLSLSLSFSLFIVSVSADALQYVRTNLTDAVGGFYSAEDADSYPYEGAPHKEEGIGVSVHSVPVCLSLSLCVHYL